ncbi:chromate efflux transporter [Microbaculum marinum]|uniref:Chromate efflux transporter n=1 Tax=Microbaculum marinum TaxID=1764581 RepID=A0AAW9RS49_9HYPH
MADQLQTSAATGGTSRIGDVVPLGEAIRAWGRIAAMSFGGPAGQIALMHQVLVEEKRWIGDTRFLHALNFCMLLPGPEAQQLAIYIGWLLNRTLGGIIAGVLFVLPGALSILALSMIYAVYGELAPIEALFFGLKAAVLAIVLQAVVRIGRRALRNGTMMAIAAASLVAIYGFDVPFPVIVAAAGLIGYVGGRMGVGSFSAGGGHGQVGQHVEDADTVLGLDVPAHAKADRGWSLRIAATFLVLWLVPPAALLALLGADNVFTEIATFFSMLAVVTFGGAYAVLAWVAQAAVQTFGWLAPGEMLDGLGLAETTPGPLIMVTQFVGFLAAFREATGLPPLLAGTLGALLTTWVTFTPCFLWIFLGAPYVERLRGNRALSAALATITAAVVGVILNLSIWFSLHVLFGEVTTFRGFGLSLDLPVPDTLDPVAALLTVAAIVAVFVLRLGMGWVLAGAALAGVLLWSAGL